MLENGIIIHDYYTKLYSRFDFRHMVICVKSCFLSVVTVILIYLNDLSIEWIICHNIIISFLLTYLFNIRIKFNCKRRHSTKVGVDKMETKIVIGKQSNRVAIDPIDFTCKQIVDFNSITV